MLYTICSQFHGSILCMEGTHAVQGSILCREHIVALCTFKFVELVEEKRLSTKLAKHFIAFCNEFNKSNSTGARMLDSFYSYV